MTAAFSSPGKFLHPHLFLGPETQRPTSVGVALSDSISRLGTRSNKFLLTVNFVQKLSDF